MRVTRLFYKTRRRYFVGNTIFRFLLFAAGEKGGADIAEALAMIQIRAKAYKILVIDDDDSFRKSFCFKLRRKFKARVEDVNSGRAAVEKVLAGNSYDLIFTDIMMAGMTGIETYRALREVDAAIRIVIMSAYSDSEEWKKAQELKDTALLHKPIPDDVLIAILSQLASY